MADGRICAKCGIWKPLSEFHRSKLGRYGRAARCKGYLAAWHAAYKDSPERKRAKKKYKQSAKGKTTNHRYKTSPVGRAAGKRYYETHKDRYAAHDVVNRRVQQGILPPPRFLACSDCGNPAQHYHHHLGYEPEHQLDVVPLCIKCHSDRHNAA